MTRCSGAYAAVRTELAECEGVLLRGDRIVMPISLRSRALDLAHEGHQGLVKTKQRIRSKVWWPRIDSDCEKVSKSCVDCLKVSSPDPPAPLSMTKFPEKPWDYLSMDILEPLPTGQHILVVADYHSRFFEAAFMKQITADKIVDFLDVTFARYGIPSALRTDNGPQFVSTVFQDFLTENCVKWFSTTPLWPQANGGVERVNRTLLKSLRISYNNGLPLHKELRKFLVAYRSTPHSTTGVAPFTLLFGREMKTKLPSVNIETSAESLQQTAADRDAVIKTKAKVHADVRVRAKDTDIVVGDNVLLQQTKSKKFDTTFGAKPYTVVGMEGSEIICENEESSSRVRRNISFAKRLPAQSEGEAEGTRVMESKSGGLKCHGGCC